MIEITKDEYIKLAVDYEKLFLFEARDHQLFLCADIEYGGELQKARIEMMNFELNTKFKISEAVIKCRGYYAGGISFIEYKENEAENKALQDSLKLNTNAKFLRCFDDELYLILEKYPDNFLYVVVQ